MLKGRDQSPARSSINPVISNIALVVLSFVFALVMAEGGLRLSATSDGGDETTAAPAGNPTTYRYAASLAAGTGLDPRFYERSPPIPQESRSINPEDKTRFLAYVGAEKFGPQSYYVWNDEYVKKFACDVDNVHFQNVPVDIRAFAAVDGEAHPIYRYLPDRRLPGGLKTNSYGFRGADFPLEKRSEMIRIAFIGSSQTVGNGAYTFSFPEYFGFWLNQWLESKGSPLRVEIINAGREGIGTLDVRAILQQEVLPLDPDYVIFFDGANQLGGSDALIRAQGPIKRQKFEDAIAARHPFPRWITAHSKVASLVDRVYDLFAPQSTDSEIAPTYQFGFPGGVDENEPDIAQPDLPLGLSGFVKDVRGMAADSRAAGAHFFMSAPFWLDGSELPDAKDRHFALIASHLKSIFWPLKPSEIRRLIDFQTRVLRRVAESDKIPLLDIAADFPRDPTLFNDAYHTNPAGVPLLGWIALQRFLPSFAADIAIGAEHQQIKAGFQPPRRAALGYFVYRPQCHAPEESVAKAKPLSMDRMVAVHDTIVTKTAFTLTGRTTAVAPWHYIATLDLRAGCVPGGGWVVAELAASGADIGVGIENKAGDDFLTRQFVKPQDNLQRVSLKVSSFDEIGKFVVQNGDNAVPASVGLSSLKVVPNEATAPSSCPESDAHAPEESVAKAKPLSMDRMVATQDTIVTKTASTLTGRTTAVVPWHYIATLDLRAGCFTGGGWVVAELAASGADIGVGIENKAGDNFLTRQFVRPQDKVKRVFLKVSSFEEIGKFVVQNGDNAVPASVELSNLKVVPNEAAATSSCPE
jgi:hypothetical protein